MKVSDLAGSQLDFWVAKAEGVEPTVDTQLKYSPSTDWTVAGPIIDREGIALSPMPAKGGTWCAISMGRLTTRPSGGTGVWMEGPTPLIAAMRAYVRAKFGPEVE